MRFACPLGLAAALVSVSSLLPACGGGRLAFASSGDRVTTEEVGATGGGFRRDEALPTLAYGTVLSNGERRYTYLVVGPPCPVLDRDTSTATGTATAEDGVLRTHHTLDVNGVVLEAEFTARHEPGSPTLTEPVLRLQNTELAADAGWCFLFDWTDPALGLQPVPVDMPVIPTDAEDLQGFTEMFVADLVVRNAVVRDFVE